MDEESLKASIGTYKSQLQQVDAALQAAGTKDNDDLVKLQTDLGELIQLTEESLLSYMKSTLLAKLESNTGSDHGSVRPPTNELRAPATREGNADMDAEFLAFQAAIQEETSSSDDRRQDDRRQDDRCQEGSAAEEARGHPESGTEGVDSDTDAVDLSAISGTKCRLAYSHEWGEKQYCNALILGVEPLELDDTPKVRVLFCNPTHRSMLPCPYFLDGNCRFSDKDCRYSHGHVVPAEDLKDFEDPDYSCLCMESACLVKDTDGVWYRAMVVGLLENHNYEVTFSNNHDVHTVDMEDILPLDNSTGDEDDSDLSEEDTSGEEGGEEEGEEEEDALPVYLWKPSQTTDMLGDWEVHTKGIGSKLMARMGYVTGQGLGKRSDGRAEPVPIQLLPQGKSLDKIMELKAIAGDQDLYDVMKKEKKKRRRRDARHTEAGPTKQTAKPKNVFDFINKKLSKKKGDLSGLVKHSQQPLRKVTKINHITSGELKKRSDKHIHIQMFKTHEEMRNVEKQIKQLKTALGRNKGSDKRVANQIQQKIASAEQYLQQLQTSERSMTQQQKARSDQKKLTVF